VRSVGLSSRRGGWKGLRFLADSMHGELSRWLRMLGYDTVYSSTADNELLNRALSEGRILLTSDKELHRRTLVKGGESILIPLKGTEDKLAAIANYLRSRHGVSHREFLKVKAVRCSLCNGPLERRTRNRWRCRDCRQEYWVGGHWRNISKTLVTVESLLASAPGNEKE
jgi:uncharacterized protein with PIN domain